MQKAYIPELMGECKFIIVMILYSKEHQWV